MKFDMVAILPAGGHSGLAERPGINRRRLPDVMTERNQLASHIVCCHTRACSVPIESGGILAQRRMGDSIGIDSLWGGWAMPRAYSGDMRRRVIAEVESGASRREAAEEFAVSASTAVILVRCFSGDWPPH